MRFTHDLGRVTPSCSYHPYPKKGVSGVTGVSLWISD
ncbi:hypothetical protein predicted by Glimmer/Critica [Acetobacter ghanensis]|uniref:Uncharacterized protein n=1 Tax=Acetobacter ghanensis TaxID=431306 RepID=A0A0U5F079_9PROT|nr:hypothetical protein predicted by Glimmer/Critica [Acetobacter ghanensis]